MTKQYQVNCAFNKEQYIVLLKYCKKNNTTPYKIIKIFLTEKCNLPMNNSHWAIDYDATIKKLESE